MADEEISRTERLLALLVLHNMAEASQVDKCVLLNRAGFGSGAIAELLGTSTATVNQNLYMARQSKGTKSVKTSKKKSIQKATKKKSARRAPRTSTKKRGR